MNISPVGLGAAESKENRSRLSMSFADYSTFA
jgi:hypothetical protein